MKGLSLIGSREHSHIYIAEKSIFGVTVLMDWTKAQETRSNSKEGEATTVKRKGVVTLGD